MNLPDVLVEHRGQIDARGHRVGLHSIVEAHREELSAEGIQDRFSSVSLDKIVAVLDFYHKKRCEVDLHVDHDREESERLIDEVQTQRTSRGLEHLEIYRRGQLRQSGAV